MRGGRFSKSDSSSQSISLTAGKFRFLAGAARSPAHRPGARRAAWLRRGRRCRNGRVAGEDFVDNPRVVSQQLAAAGKLADIMDTLHKGPAARRGGLKLVRAMADKAGGWVPGEGRYSLVTAMEETDSSDQRISPLLSGQYVSMAAATKYMARSSESAPLELFATPVVSLLMSRPPSRSEQTACPSWISFALVQEGEPRFWPLMPKWARIAR